MLSMDRSDRLLCAQSAASVAQALAAAISGDGGSAATAAWNGSNGMTLTSRQSGSSSSYPLSAGWTYNTGNFSSPSFTVSAPGALSGGANAQTTTVYDSGQVTVSAGSTTQTVSYGQGSSASDVSASANGSALNLTAKQSGSSGNYGLSASITYDTANFSQASFSPAASGGSLSGGDNSISNPVTLYSFTISSYAPDGNVLAVTDSFNGTWSYTYDDLDRLATATLNPGTSSPAALAWNYDAYGNRWKQTITSGAQSWPQPNYSFSGGNNRATQFSYDAAGNVLYDGTSRYSYDDENRIVSVSGGGSGSYVYNADGMRVQANGSAGPVDYTYDLAGHAVGTFTSGSGAYQRGEIYAGPLHVATYVNGATYFSHTDWQGTERVRSTVSGTAEEHCSSLPFGDAMFCDSTDTSPLHLTGKQRDTESGNDYFGTTTSVLWKRRKLRFLGKRYAFTTFPQHLLLFDPTLTK